MEALTLVQKFFPDVTKVKDARSDIEIEVTKADGQASPKDHKNCAIARACKRGLNLDGAVVSRSVVYLVKDDEATRYLIPNAVAREMVAFDRGAGFAPGEYELKRPASHKMGPGTHSRKPRKPGSRPRGKPRHQTAGLRSKLMDVPS